MSADLPEPASARPTRRGNELADAVTGIVGELEQRMAARCDDALTYATDYLGLEELAARLQLGDNAQARAILERHRASETTALFRLYR